MNYENYFIAIIDESGNEWCILESTDYEYIYQVFEDMTALPDYHGIELRGTNEDVDTCISYEVLRYDYR